MIDDPLLTENIGALSRSIKEAQDILESEFFDYHSIQKYISTLAKLRAGVLSNESCIYFGNNLKHLSITPGGKPPNILDPEFLSKPLEELPRNCVYFLLNNDIGNQIELYKSLYNHRPCSLFILWDWDSQHWVEMSCTLAAYSDFYIPVSSENSYTIGHLNPFVLGPVFVGVNQWRKDFVINNIEVLLANRVDDPYGPHVGYSAYQRRNRAVATLNQKFPHVGFTDNSYKTRTELEVLTEWCGYKAHWIVPVRSGMPIRLYNCLVTGGIPLVPGFYRYLLESSDLPPDVMYYDVLDLIEPDRLVEIANRHFDQQGTDGLTRRVGDFLNRYHIDARCLEILELLRERVRSLFK